MIAKREGSVMSTSSSNPIGMQDSSCGCGILDGKLAAWHPYSSRHGASPTWPGRIPALFERAGRAAALLLLAAVAAPVHAVEPARFDWFEYTGRDRAFEPPLPHGHYRNPILAGFHPDPGVTRAGD